MNEKPYSYRNAEEVVKQSEHVANTLFDEQLDLIGYSIATANLNGKTFLRYSVKDLDKRLVEALFSKLTEDRYLVVMYDDETLSIDWSELAAKKEYRTSRFNPKESSITWWQIFSNPFVIGIEIATIIVGIGLFSLRVSKNPTAALELMVILFCIAILLIPIFIIPFISGKK